MTASTALSAMLLCSAPQLTVLLQDDGSRPAGARQPHLPGGAVPPADEGAGGALPPADQSDRHPAEEEVCWGSPRAVPPPRDARLQPAQRQQHPHPLPHPHRLPHRDRAYPALQRGLFSSSPLSDTDRRVQVVFRAVSPHGHVYWEIDPKRPGKLVERGSDSDTNTDLHNMSDFSEDDGKIAGDRSRQSSSRFR